MGSYKKITAEGGNTYTTNKMSQLYIKFLYQHIKKLHEDRKCIISNYEKLHDELLDKGNIIIFQDNKEKILEQWYVKRKNKNSLLLSIWLFSCKKYIMK